MTPRNDQRRVELSAEEFKELFEAVSNWGRWDADDERGALNELTADRVAAAARLVRGWFTAGRASRSAIRWTRGGE